MKMLGEANTQGLILDHTIFTLKFSGVTKGTSGEAKNDRSDHPNLWKFAPRSIATARSCDMDNGYRDRYKIIGELC